MVIKCRILHRQTKFFNTQWAEQSHIYEILKITSRGFSPFLSFQSFESVSKNDLLGVVKGVFVSFESFVSFYSELLLRVWSSTRLPIPIIRPTTISISNLLVEVYTFASNWRFAWTIFPLPHAHRKTWVADCVSFTICHQIICWRFSLFNIYLCFQLSLSHHDLPFFPCPSSDLQSRLFVVGFYWKPPLLPIVFAPLWSSLFLIPIKIPS